MFVNHLLAKSNTCAYHLVISEAFFFGVSKISLEVQELMLNSGFQSFICRCSIVSV